MSTLASQAPRTLLQALTQEDARARAGLLTNFLIEELARRLGVERGEIEPRTALLSLGVSSLQAIELKVALESELGLPLPSSLMFDYPTLEALVPYLLARAALLPASAGEGAAQPAPVRSSRAESTSTFNDAAEELARQLAQWKAER